MRDPRTERIAETEVRFRDINERLRGDLEALAGESEPVYFVCECGNPECRDGVPLALRDYMAIRANPLRFGVVPGHEIPDVETVIERHDDYLVIEKPAEVADIVA